MRYRAYFLIAGFLAVGLCRADVTLASLFCDRAVLQRDLPVPVWGTGEPGEHVAVNFSGQTLVTRAGPDGRWSVELRPMPANLSPGTLTVSGRNVVKVSDVLVGEVWLASGQSNMEWAVRQTLDAENEIAAAEHPAIREFAVRKVVADVPQGSVRGQWTSCSPENVRRFSAVAYFFAREVHRATGVPVGIINSCFGGTPVESWVKPETLENNSAFKPALIRWQQALKEYPTKKIEYDDALDKWRRADEAAAARSKAEQEEFRRTNRRPYTPRGPGHSWTPGGLYNAMIAPLVGYTLGGIIWYQGESNTNYAEEYEATFPTLIQQWRAAWGRDIPFYFVQLANFKGLPGELAPNQWPWLREAQTRALALPGTGMAVTIDIGDKDDIHPLNKQEVGRRLALIARAQLWHEPLAWCGPIYAGMKREGKSLRLSFSHAGGLNSGGKQLKDLVIAGEDRQFHPADARVEGETLVIESPDVPIPLAVRYAWSNAPDAHLRNGAGLPAPPFRTDDWLR